MIGESGFVCKSSLRDFYLLTDKWIEQLGPPDKTVPNPHYRTSPPMQLWAVARVEEFIALHEDDSKFAAMQAKRRETIATRAKRRTERERAQYEKCRAKLRELAQCAITIRTLPRDLPKALRRSRAQRDNGFFVGDGMTRHDALNFVRHERSNYHDLLNELYDLSCPEAALQAYEIVKRRVNEAAMAALMKHPGFADLRD